MEEILSDQEIRIVKWKIRIGSQISLGNILMLYRDATQSNSALPKRLKSVKCGVVKKLFYRDGDKVEQG